MKRSDASASRYFDDAAWPVQAAVLALGVLLIGLVAQEQAMKPADWPENTWLTIGAIGLTTVTAIIVTAFIDPRIVRRPLQLALVLCLIVHAVLVVQMVHARLEMVASSDSIAARVSPRHREPKRIADYRPVEHLPEESRPRQDFERPVEAEISLNSERREEVAQQKLPNDEPELSAPVPAAVENQLKPQMAEPDRKVDEKPPESPMIQSPELPRSVTEVQIEASPTIELPAATVDTQVASAEIEAAAAAVRRRDVVAPREAPTQGAAEFTTRPKVVVDQPMDGRRRIPIYQPPDVKVSAEPAANSGSRGPAQLADSPASEIVTLPALEQAVVEQAMRDHRPIAATTQRSAIERAPLTVRNAAGDPAAEKTAARGEKTLAAARTEIKRTEINDRGVFVPDNTTISARPSRSVAAPSAVAAVVPREAFSGRAARLRSRSGIAPGEVVQESEDAIERGLVFLARQQRADGSWSLQGFAEGASLVSDTAATALAVMAFQGAGYNHREQAYRDVIARGLTFLLSRQRQNGDLFVPLDDASNRSVWLYSHALATIALCEAYGMTQDATLGGPAQRAIDFIVAGQQMERGGWRYAPGVGADTSVSGWMTMALKSGELAGLAVPAAIYDKIDHWLNTAQQSASAPYLYCYNPYAPESFEQRHGRVTSKTMTAVGLLMRLYTGWRRDDANVARGAAYLAANLPAEGNSRQNERDTYYWYYATQVMAQAGGESGQAWSDRLQPLLVNSQIRSGPMAGSWDPLLPIPDRWGPQAGRLYVTAMNLLSLEVEWRKLPVEE